MHWVDALTTQLAAASTFEPLSDGWMCPERPSAGSQIMSSNARSGASEHQDPLHYMPASCARGGEGSRRTFRLRLMSPRAHRDREAKVSLLQRCRSGGRRRLTAPMLCTDAPTIGSGWGLHGMVFYGRRRLTNACVHPMSHICDNGGEGVKKLRQAICPGGAKKPTKARWASDPTPIDVCRQRTK